MNVDEKDVPSPGADTAVPGPAPIDPPPRDDAVPGIDPPVSPAVPLDKIYAEAGHWVRMVNTVTWTLAAFLLPASISLLVAVYTTTFPPLLLGSASILLIGLWHFADHRYSMGVDAARVMLEGIEAHWGISPEFGFYTQQNLRIAKRPTFRDVFVVIGLTIVLIWILVAFGLLPGPTKNDSPDRLSQIATSIDQLTERVDKLPITIVALDKSIKALAQQASTLEKIVPNTIAPIPAELRRISVRLSELEKAVRTPVIAPEKVQ